MYNIQLPDRKEYRIYIRNEEYTTIIPDRKEYVIYIKLEQ